MLISAIFFLFSVAVFPARADWTVPLPEPKPIEGSARLLGTAGPGVLVHVNTGTTDRFLWYSTDGLLLAELTGYNWESMDEAFFLNARQMLIEDEPGLVLLTSNGPGSLATTTYSFTDSQHFRVPSRAPQESAAIYYTDDAAWTLTRMDFLKPPPLAGRSVVLTLQGAEKLDGPWQAISSGEAPVEKPHQFFRLEVHQP